LEIFFVGEVNSAGDEAVDLFGEPVRALERGRGRPPHVPTRETQNRVWLGFARGWSPKKVAESIGVSVPTLRQYYFAAVAQRDRAALMIESLELGRLNDQAEKGNVTAERALMAALEKGRREQLAEQHAVAAPKRGNAKVEKLGKKEAAKVAAAGVKGRFAPPEPPSLLN
jgi:hypothetical protein